MLDQLVNGALGLACRPGDSRPADALAPSGRFVCAGVEETLRCDGGDGLPAVARDRRDPMGDMVKAVFARTPDYVIYLVEGGSDASLDGAVLRYLLPENAGRAERLRARLAPVGAQLSAVSNVLSCLRPIGGVWRARHECLRWRTWRRMARAIEYALSDFPETAAAVLADAMEEVVERRDSLNRMRYSLVNFGSLVFWLLSLALAAAYWPADLLRLGEAQPAPLPLMMGLGAVGAFFSVCVTFPSLRINPHVSMAEMLWSGFIRIPIGFIAAAAAALLFAAGQIGGAGDGAGGVHAVVLLIGFLAGFSESLIPNALKSVAASRGGAAETAGREDEMRVMRMESRVKEALQRIEGAAA